MTKREPNQYHYTTAEGSMRNDFLAEARKLVVAGGTNWSMREISKILGVSTGAPYRHFKNKMECEKALCSMGWLELKAIAAPGALGLLEQMQRWVRDNAVLFHLMLTPKYSSAMVSQGVVFHRDFDKLMQQVVRHYWDTCCASHVSEEDGARPTVEIPPSRIEQAPNGSAPYDRASAEQ